MPAILNETSEYLKNLKKVMLIQQMVFEIYKYMAEDSDNEDRDSLVQGIRSTRLEYDTLIKELFYE